MTPTTPTPQHLQAFARVNSRYSGTNLGTSFFIQGGFGTGKTSFILTGRRPILIFAFDPGYMALEAVRKGIDEGWLYVNYFGDDDEANPTAFKNWEQLVMQYEREQIFKHFGTIGVDSGTFCLTALSNYIRHNPLTEKNFSRPIGVMSQGDYQPYYGYVEKWIRKLQTYGTDFVWTHHITTKDKVKTIGGKEMTETYPVVVKAYGQLGEILPALFPERYVIMKEPAGQKQKHVLYTNNISYFSAATRMGSTKFDWREEPNIKKLLAKAGLPTEDKPWSKIVQPQTT